MARPNVAIMERWREFARSRGLKSTRQRDLILAEFLRCQGHVSIEELLGRVRRRSPRVGYVTVYRTLKLLAEAGLVAARHFGDGQTRFEVADGAAGPHHDHLICLDCGRIIEFANPEIERLQAQVASQLGFEVVSHKLEIYGHCAHGHTAGGRPCPPAVGRIARKGLGAAGGTARPGRQRDRS